MIIERRYLFPDVLQHVCLRTLLLMTALLLLTLPEVSFAGHDGNRNTSTVVSCAPDPANAHDAVTCTATVSDLYGVPGQRSAPLGTVNFSVVSGPGNLSPTSCTLIATATTGVSSCSVTYTPTAGGTHTISGDYSGGVATAFVGNWLPSSGNTSITVNNPTPVITSINPIFGLRGDTLDVTINGSDFASVGMTATFGAGVTVNTVTWISSTTLVANVSIDVATTTGFRDVAVTNPAPAGGTATLAGAFEVRNPAPVINSLTPSAAEAGSGALIVTIDGTGFVTDSVAWFNGGARSTSFVNSTQLQMSLTAGDTATVGSYPVTVVNATPGGGTSNTVQFSVVVSGGSFDSVETGAALGTTMFTKLAGSAFTFDLLATDVSRTSVNTSFTGTVAIELLDATDDSGALDANGCRPSWTTLQALPNQAFAAANNGRISVNTSYADSVRVARFRVSYPAAGVPSRVGCSSDAFSIRPTALTLSSALNNGANTGTPIHAAGTAFSMSATAVAGYTGTPQINASLMVTTSPNTPATPGAVSGAFAAANAVTGVSSGSSFTYNEVGNFRFSAEGIYDSNFTAVDQPGDCTADFSNAAVGGQYGCSFGNTADTQWVGRFTPAYFDVTVSDACTDGSGFTYSGQPFMVTITAREAGGAITQNYAGNLAKQVTLSNAGDTSNFGSTNVVAAMDFDAGPGVANNIDVTYTFAAATTPFTTLTMRAVDTDGVSSSGHVEETTEIRSARLTIGTASAVTTNDALLGVMLQAWQETSPGFHEWAVHASDTTCTTPVMADFSVVVGSGTGNLDDSETSINGFFFNAGEGALTLSAPGAGNDGSVDVSVTIDPWLYFDWSGTGNEAPEGTVSFFEIFETEEGFIDRFEVIPN